MKNKFLRKSCTAGGLIIALFTFGCADYAAVTQYAGEMEKLSSAAKPLLSDTTTICVEKFKRKKMLTSGSYNPQKVEQLAFEICAPIEEGNKIVEDLNSLLTNYAEMLVALTDEELPSYKRELDGLKTSLGKLKVPGDTPGTVKNAVDKNQLAAVTSLLNFLGREITQYKTKVAINKLLERQDELKIVTDTLKIYADRNYQGWISDSEHELTILSNDVLKNSAAAEPLTSRYLSSLLYEEHLKNSERKKLVKSYIESIDKLQSAHEELKNKWETPDDKELIKQLAGFAGEVYQLQSQIQHAF